MLICLWEKIGILQHASTSSEQYAIEAEKEELRLNIVAVQTEILKTEGRQATPEDIADKLKDKYSIDLIYEETVASSANPSLKAIGAKVTKKGSQYKFTVDEKLVITNVEVIGRVEEVVFPENTPSNPQDAGKEVAMNEKWYTMTPTYTNTTNGQVVTNSTKTSSVYAVAVGNGDTVPVPYGFWYVGGTLASGVVISDEQADQLNGKYFGQAKVPSGISVTDDGKLVNEFIGNQFVWIPCTENEYVKSNWSGDGKTQGDVANRSNTCWDTTVDVGGKNQVKKYGGFYVGRYEAGLPEGVTEYSEEQIWNSSFYNNKGIPQSKAGVLPWNFVDWDKSKVSAESMYDNTNKAVHSGLITGAQWDVMIKKIESAASKSLTSSGDWGNYYDIASTYNGRCSILNTSTGKLGVFGNIIKEGNKGINVKSLLTTGAADKVNAYNTYDVAGNLWEWTDETSFYKGNSEEQYRVRRGGSYEDSSSAYPACYRTGSGPVNTTNYCIGFRVTLYIK